MIWISCTHIDLNILALNWLLCSDETNPLLCSNLSSILCNDLNVIEWSVSTYTMSSLTQSSVVHLQFKQHNHYSTEWFYTVTTCIVSYSGRCDTCQSQLKADSGAALQLFDLIWYHGVMQWFEFCRFLILSCYTIFPQKLILWSDMNFYQEVYTTGSRGVFANTNNSAAWTLDFCVPGPSGIRKIWVPASNFRDFFYWPFLEFFRQFFTSGTPTFKLLVRVWCEKLF